jgi:hypothetical protein
MPRPIDWLRILKDNRIPYIESGANVKRGEVAIKCCFCGSADPSMHMGLSLETGWWSCWRNRKQHSGKSPLRLLMQLLKVPYGVARELAGLGADYVDPEGFDAMAAKLLRIGSREDDARPTRRKLTLDADFRIIEEQGRTRPHFNYLVDTRGFYVEDVERLGAEYGICAGVSGDFAGRVVMPYYQDGDLVTWTARAVGRSAIRYRDLELESSILPPKMTLYNHDSITAGGVVLVLQEGPFDALKVDCYGKAWGVRSVALSTNSIQDEQVYLLQAAASTFEHVVVMMDNKDKLDITDSLRMRAELALLPSLSISAVPFGVKDGGDLTPKQVKQWAQQITGEKKWQLG